MINYLNFTNECKKLYDSLFIEDLKNTLGFLPCEIIISEQQQQIRQSIESLVRKKIDSINQNYPILRQKVWTQINAFLASYMENDKFIFDAK